MPKYITNEYAIHTSLETHINEIAILHQNNKFFFLMHNYQDKSIKGSNRDRYYNIENESFKGRG